MMSGREEQWHGARPWQPGHSERLLGGGGKQQGVGLVACFNAEGSLIGGQITGGMLRVASSSMYGHGCDILKADG